MEENNSNAYEREISIIKILGIIKRFWLYILIVTLAFAAGTAIYKKNFVKNTYSSTVMFYTFSGQYGQLGNELNAAKTLVDSYTVVLKNSKSFANDVAEMAGITENGISTVRSMLSMGALEETEAFYINATSTDRDLALKVAEAVAICAEKTINDVVGAGSMTVFDPPSLAKGPNDPGITQSVIMSAIIGFLFSAAFFVVINIFDNHVRTEEDLAVFGLPILGTIPTIENDAQKKKILPSFSKNNTKGATK